MNLFLWLTLQMNMELACINIPYYQTLPLFSEFLDMRHICKKKPSHHKKFLSTPLAVVIIEKKKRNII